MICAYSIEDIDQAFSTSKLRGYSSPFIGSRPGMVRKRLSFSFYFRKKNQMKVCVHGGCDSACIHRVASFTSASAKTRLRWVRTT